MDDRTMLLSIRRDARGFPLPGQVIRYYRRRAVYTDGQGKKRCWTQKDLAKILNLSEVSIRAMEKQSKFLDSVERRRFICEVLGIPFILLGLGATADLERLLANPQVATAARKQVTPETMDLYYEGYEVYSRSHSNGSIASHLQPIEAWIDRIVADIPAAGSFRHELYQLLWMYHYLLAKVYGNDLEQYKLSFRHLNTAMSIADSLNDMNLRASTLYLSAEIHFAEQSFALARSDMNAAIGYAKNATPGVKTGVYTYAALAYALTRNDRADDVYIERLLDQAANTADNKMDVSLLRMDYGKYCMDAADALATVGNFPKALSLLDESELYIDSSRPRRYAQIQLLRALIAIASPSHEYEYATGLLTQAHTIGSSVNSSYTLGFVRRLHAQLGKTNFVTHPKFAELTKTIRFQA